MKKHVKFKPEGVCSRKIEFDIEDGIIHNVTFKNGCKGNLAALSVLAEGASAEELVKKLKGIQCKGEKSCPNQFAIAIEQNL